MDHNDKRNSSVPLGTFEPTAHEEGESAADLSEKPFEGREDTWPSFTIGADRPRRRTRTLMGVPGLVDAARDSQPGEDVSDRPTVPDSPSARENISQAIAEELNLSGKTVELPSAAEPVQVTDAAHSETEPLDASIEAHVDPEFDPDAQEVTSVYDADIVALADSTPSAEPIVVEADGGGAQEPNSPSLIEVAPPPEPAAADARELRDTIPELPSELAGEVPLLADHMRSPRREREAEPITITEIAPPIAAEAAPASTPPANLSSLAPREVTRKRAEPAPVRDHSGRNGALLVAAVMLLATGAWYLTSGTFRRASLTEAPAPAPTTAAVSQPAVAHPTEPSTKPLELANRMSNDSASEPASNASAVAANAANAPNGAPPSAAAPSLSGSVKGKPTLTATSRSLRVKPAPRAKQGLVPPPSDGMQEQPTRTQVVERLESVRSSVRACAAGRSGVADLDITIAHTGAVMHVLVGGDFAGTTEGSCIARAVRTARFPTFKQERFRLLFPYAI